MSSVRIDLPTPLKATIDREVANGRVASEADFLLEAARRFAEDLDAEQEIAAIAMRGIADMEAGRFVTISSAADTEALHQRIMDRLRARLASDAE
jgi:Arc/MetJ-type ribon-helix-helix transcriptional regulator